MKLIIQIPCYNEEETLPTVLADLPTEIEGIDVIETLIIDDGSQDRTTAVAQAHGVDYIVRHTHNLRLARAFQNGLTASLRYGADIIVNTDADNQYPGQAIADLVAPILRGEADIVIGDRQVQTIAHFSPVKKRLQKFGSWVVRTISGTNVPDTVSGFRAYSREAALRLDILSEFSYTLETIIQAGKQNLAIKSVPIHTNGPTRPSRLQRNMGHFIKSQASTIVRMYAFYEPLRTFTYITLPFFFAGLFLLARFAYFHVIGEGGHTQSVAIGSGLFITSVLIFLTGVLADIISKHRRLTQETLYRLKKLELSRRDFARDGEGD